MTDTKTNSTPNAYDVIIIGSGLAGLGAARTLQNAGRRFLVLEAQNYVGGRVKSKSMKTTVHSHSVNKKFKDLVDLGAQWLHGEQNALHEIASKHELLSHELSEEGLGSYIREDGYIFEDLFYKKIDFEIGRILTECESFTSRSTKDYPKSVQHYLENEFEKYVNQLKTEKEKEMAMQVFDWHRRFQIIDNSCLSLDEVSAKYWGMYSFNGESCQAHINFRNGFSSVIDAVSREIDPDSVKLNSKVIEIDWDVMERHRQMVSIQTDCGKLYWANHVIVTCSLGVLKENHEKMFKPILPKKIRNAINQIGFNTINKIFMQFEESWWKPMDGIQLIFNNDNHYLNAKWTRFLSGFDILSPGAPNTLIGWVGSYGAIEMEKLSDDQIVNDCIELLSSFTKKQVPFPIKFECSRWGSNEFIRGGYSYLSTKCDESGFNGTTLSQSITIRDLLETKSSNLFNFNNLSINGEKTNGFSAENGIGNNPVSIDPCKSRFSENFDFSNNDCNTSCVLTRPILLFAGEACHPKYFSTAHGAFLSGIEQAQTILKHA